MKGEQLSRRIFLGQMALASAAAALVRAPESLGVGGWLESAHAASADVLHDTFNGLMAFVVPGRDEYSIQQGVVSDSPGGVEAGGVDGLIATIDESTPYFPNFSAAIAAILNGTALAVNPGAAGPFVSPFARLSSQEKAAVFQYMDGTDTFKVLAGVLPAFVAFFVYSEAGTFDPITRSLTGVPVGWTISDYQGVADGRDEFLGYLKGK
jgi:hypothetical protein